MRSPVIAIIIGTLLPVCGSTAPQQLTAERILLDSTLWGPDFAAVLPVLVALRDSGETRAYIFTDSVAGASPLSSDTATGRAEKLRALVARPRAVASQFAKLQKPTTGAFRIETARLLDDDGDHIVAARRGAQFLAKGLTVEMVRSRLGEPERVVEQVIQNRTERRPVILKLHIYAGGAIAFAESNMAEPNVIERVVVDLEKVAPVLTR